MIILNVLLTLLCIYLYRQTKRCTYTGLLNKEQFNKDCRRIRKEVIILIDINKFKQINDTKGHKYGDLVIDRVAQTIRKSIRLSDKAYRIGGDEFAIITSHRSVGERIREALSVSVSIGYGHTYEEADKSMYEEKHHVA